MVPYISSASCTGCVAQVGWHLAASFSLAYIVMMIISFFTFLVTLATGDREEQTTYQAQQSDFFFPLLPPIFFSTTRTAWSVSLTLVVGSTWSARVALD